MDYFGLRYVKAGHAQWINLRNSLREQLSPASTGSAVELRVKYFVNHSQLLQPETRRRFFLDIKSHLAEGKYNLENTAQIMALLLRSEYGEEALNESNSKQLLRNWIQTNDVRALEGLRTEHAHLRGVTSKEAEGLLMGEVEGLLLHGAEFFTALSSVGEDVAIAVCRDGVRVYGQGMLLIDEYLYSSELYPSVKGKYYNLEISEGHRGYKVTYKLPTTEMARSLYRTSIEFYTFFSQDTVGDWVMTAAKKSSRLSSLTNLIHSPKDYSSQRYLFDVIRTENEVFEFAWRAIAEEKALELQMEFRPSLPPALPKTPRALGNVFQFGSVPPIPLTAKNRLLERSSEAKKARLRLASGYLTSDRLATNQTFNGFFPTMSCLSNLKPDFLSSTGNSDQNKSTVSAQEFANIAREMKEAYSVEKQKEMLKSAMFCKLCSNKWRNATFMPCRHVVACIDCALKCRTCAECDGNVTRITCNNYP